MIIIWVKFLSMDVTKSDGQVGHLLALPPAAGLFYPFQLIEYQMIRVGGQI